MFSPVVRGTIERRLLLNIRIQPEAIRPFIPEAFELQLVNGWAMAGICLIRFGGLRLKALPFPVGISTENAAHRIAVYTDAERTTTGVYVPRRDTSSFTTANFGKWILPGAYHHAKFQVDESEQRFQINVRSKDETTAINVEAHRAEQLSSTSVFESLAEASEFYRNGSLGYSDSETSKGTFDGIELVTHRWEVEPLEISRFESSYFRRLPKESFQIDNGLLMTQIPSDWARHTGDT